MLRLVGITTLTAIALAGVLLSDLPLWAVLVFLCGITAGCWAALRLPTKDKKPTHPTSGSGELRTEEAAYGETLMPSGQRNRLYVSSSIGILLSDATGTIRWVNPTFCEQLVLPDNATDTALSAHPTLAFLRAPSATPSNNIHWVTIDEQKLLVTVDSNPSGLLVVAALAPIFDASQPFRTELVSNIAHELRTPIATILGYAETLTSERDQLSPDQLLLAKTIFRNCTRLRDLFEDMLALARIEAKQGHLPKNTHHVISVLQESVAPAADAAHSRGISLSLQCPEHLYYETNEEALKTIVSNLLTNATMHSPEGGQIEVVCRQVEQQLWIQVTDDGPGIAPEYHERVFERFFRVDGGRSRAQGGSGMGLAIAKHLAIAAGGRIELESELGQGATFTLIL